MDAGTAPPPNSVKSIVTDAMSPLLSPLTVLSHVAVTASPILNVPPVPVAPVKLMLEAVTTGGFASTVALLLSAAVVALPASSVAVTATLRFAPDVLVLAKIV